MKGLKNGEKLSKNPINNFISTCKKGIFETYQLKNYRGDE